MAPQCVGPGTFRNHTAEFREHAGICAALVLHDGRATDIVQPKRVTPAPVQGTGAVLGRQEPNAQQRLHVRLNQPLYVRLDLSKTRHDLGHAAIHHVRAKQLQARPLLGSEIPLLGSEIINAAGVRDCFREKPLVT